MKLALILQLFVVPLFAWTVIPSTAKGTHEPVADAEGNYHFRLEENQWRITAYDLNALEEEYGTEFLKNIAEVDDKEITAIREANAITHRVGIAREDGTGGFARGSKITLDVYTRDVQHGFSINEVGLNLATVRPRPGQVFGDPVSAEFEWPDEDITISAFCHIFCGLGHPDMKIKWVVGAGSFEWGPPVYYAFIALNVGIMALIVRSIFGKLEFEESQQAAA